MAAAPIEGISLSLRLKDIWEKVTTVWAVAKNMGPGGAFQLASVDVKGVQYKVFKNLPPALGNYYRQWFKKFASNGFLQYVGERYTFEEAGKLVDALAVALVDSFGVKPGDKVGIAMRNLPEFCIAFLGITAAGCVAVPLNALWGAEELEYAVKDSGSKVLIADPERLKLCSQFMLALGVKGILCRGDTSMAEELGGATLWSDVIEKGKNKPPPPLDAIGAEDEAMIMYTSGSTGFPKGVVHTQRSVGTSMKVGELLAATMPDPEAKFLLAVPLFHITALGLVFLWCLPSGTELVMMKKWEAGEALNLIEQQRVTKFTGVPTMIRDMLEHPSFSAERVKTVKSLAAGGAPVPPTQVAEMHKKTGSASSAQGYGLTETHAVTVNKGVDYLKHPSSCGKPIPMLVELKIEDPETKKRLPEGQRGELCIKSAMNMKGYHNLPEKTADAIDSEGFFHSGDIAKIEGGFVYILDRLKDLIIRGGENIDCSEVEAALYMHPNVRECSVFGLPDERLGEVVGVAIWWQGDVAPTTADISTHAASKLARFKVPQPEHIFLHTEELPKGATGKLDKKGLREKYSNAIKGAPMSKL